MNLAALLAALLALGAPPPAPETAVRTPVLTTATPMAVQRLWERIKDLGALKSQLVAIRDRNAHAQVCEGLVDLRSLAAPGGPLAGLGFRDHYRDRGWARPTLARVLAVARERLRREFPGRELTVGDVAQPGCGQIAHGVVIRLLEGAAAEAWLAAARPHAGALTSVRMARAADFPLEAHRFADPGQRIRVVSTARALSRGKGQGTRLRLAETRYREGSGDEGWSLRETFARLARRGLLVGHEGGAEGLSRWHFVDPARGLQLEVLAPGRGLPRLADAREVRIARWQDKKPGSFPGEVLWLRQGEAWETWSQVAEAGHISHLGGLDVDIAYMTHGNARHFAVDPGAMDVPATWRWFELLVEVARELRAPVEAILVDASILAHLRAKLPMRGRGSLARHPLWRLLASSPGHDGHHHVRIAEPSPQTEQLARAALLVR